MTEPKRTSRATIRSRVLRAGLSALLLAIAASAAAQDTAQKQTFYEAEVIIFAHQPGESDRTAERWRPVVAAPDFTDVAAFQQPILHSDGMIRQIPAGFRKLNADNGRLRSAADKLRSSDKYRVIRHLFWRQPPTEPAKALPLRVRAGDPMTLRVPTTGFERPKMRQLVDRQIEQLLAKGGDGEQQADGDEASEDDTSSEGGAQTAESASGEANSAESAQDPTGAGADTDLAAPATAQPGADTGLGVSGPSTPFGSGMFVPSRRETKVYPLDGTVTLAVSRYLHVYANFHYTATVDWQAEVRARRQDNMNGETNRDEPASSRPQAVARNLQGEAALSYPLHQKRRMRSATLHYLDHPVLGILVYVEPVERAPADAPSNASQPADE